MFHFRLSKENKNKMSIHKARNVFTKPVFKRKKKSELLNEDIRTVRLSVFILAWNINDYSLCGEQSSAA